MTNPVRRRFCPMTVNELETLICEEIQGNSPLPIASSPPHQGGGCREVQQAGTSRFERFGGAVDPLRECRPALRPGARSAEGYFLQRDAEFVSVSDRPLRRGQDQPPSPFVSIAAAHARADHAVRPRRDTPRVE